MKTVNSLSGGKTSSYIAANYKADYNVFALVRTNDKKCLWLNGKDEKTRQIVSDKIGQEFIGTLEEDTIIYTILDLEQFIGQKIDWVTGKTFDEVIFDKGKNAQIYLPQANMRFCTQEMKLKPIFNWWKKNINEVVEMRIGFRANEQRRANSMMEKLDDNGVLSYKDVIGKSKNGNRNKWGEIAWQKPTFPLIDNVIFKDKIVNYWKDKPVRFAWVNNCVGCMMASPYYLKHQHNKNQNKIEWFIEQEKKSFKMGMQRTWRIDGLTYEKIIAKNIQTELFDDDFNECDSGHCGL